MAEAVNMGTNHIDVISIDDQLRTLTNYWDPLIIGELNDQLVKIAKVKGEFVMHHHENEDEMFMVLDGVLSIEFENYTKEIEQGEIIIIPRGVPHKPVAQEEVHILLFEPNSTLNTGNIENELTRKELKRV